MCDRGIIDQHRGITEIIQLTYHRAAHRYDTHTRPLDLLSVLIRTMIVRSFRNDNLFYLNFVSIGSQARRES